MTSKTLVTRAALAVVLATVASGASARDLNNDGVGSANQRFPGVTQATRTARGFTLAFRARGIAKVENPSGLITHFGYLSDGATQPVEATKTEPDENTYLVLDHNPGGPTAGFEYGRHFLFQGHENGGDLSYVTRINLDVADAAHRITLLTPTGADGKTHFNRIDGSVWNPFTGTLLFAQENGNTGGVFEIPVEFGTSEPRTLYGSLGRGGYEGIHPDDQGRIYLAEDVGGSKVRVDPNDPTSVSAARVPNSYIYRFVPVSPSDLSAGKLQALQVLIDGVPVTYVPIDATHPNGDAFSTNQKKIYTPGLSSPVRWVTVHDTAVDGTADFDANALARAAGATPFKRPENVAFVPNTGFHSFVFAPTGDTDVNSGNRAALAARGAWGAILRVDLDGGGDTGTIETLYLGDPEHAAFDNLTFASEKILLVGEDRGDGLHKQLNRLDSVWAIDISESAAAPVRLLALGRDPSSTHDAALLDAATPGYQNDGDNEPTGILVSDGDPSVDGLLGHRPPVNARWFFTQQHGRNFIYEFLGDLNVQ